MSEPMLPPCKYVHTVTSAQMLTHVGTAPGIPVEPPVKLEAGESIEIWWYIKGGELKYHHSGSRELELNDLRDSRMRR